MREIKVLVYISVKPAAISINRTMVKKINLYFDSLLTQVVLWCTYGAFNSNTYVHVIITDWCTKYSSQIAVLPSQTLSTSQKRIMLLYLLMHYSNHPFSYFRTGACKHWCHEYSEL